eukprot:3359783-Amphidinium_carterae.3
MGPAGARLLGRYQVRRGTPLLKLRAPRDSEHAVTLVADLKSLTELDLFSKAHAAQEEPWVQELTQHPNFYHDAPEAVNQAAPPAKWSLAGVRV